MVSISALKPEIDTNEIPKVIEVNSNPAKEYEHLDTRVAEEHADATTLISEGLSDNQAFPKQEQQEQRVLVNRALQGDHQAFGEIVDAFGSLMFRTAMMIVGDRDIAEDVVQDALIQAWHHLPDLREAGALRPWLMRIVVNQCISFKRRLARSTSFMRQALSDQETDLIAQAADDHKGRMERDWDLAHAIEELPAKQKVVIVLHYYNGMTLPEMAQALHTSENTLKKRIQAALINLRRVLRNSDEDENAVRQRVFAHFAPSMA